MRIVPPWHFCIEMVFIGSQDFENLVCAFDIAPTGHLLLSSLKVIQKRLRELSLSADLMPTGHPRCSGAASDSVQARLEEATRWVAIPTALF